MDLITAVREGKPEVVENILRQGCDVHTKNDAALRIAAGRGNAEIIAALIANGANVHANGDEALYAAVERGHVNAAELLLEAGANVHRENDEALCSSCALRGRFAMVSMLVRHGADVRACENTPVRVAVGNGELETAKLLIEAGADVRYCGYEFAQAVEKGWKDMVQMLVEAGIPIQTADLRSAYYSGRNDIFEILRKPSDVFPPPHGPS
jgi:ankyrin repeat protein